TVHFHTGIHCSLSHRNRLFTFSGIFTCHLDTFGEKQIDVIHDLSVEGLILTNEKSILGADDKAGMSIMLYMIKHNIPGVYYFFIGEELGGLGSYRISKYDPDYFNKFQRMISFDRRGVSDIITYQRGERTCSDSFADALASSLNIFGFYYSKFPGGSFTDSYNFKDLIPECTNISVGYYDQHTVTESQNINHLEKLAEACVLIHWERLPTLR
ncbi:hypothetical protein, partial [Myroides marinus]|uniref:hypothetical protein n=1 Tax=Myroides marinus TaxID=703342 RepID=UPI000AEF4B50